VTVYLVRHAKAGDREKWEGDDNLRPLTRAGLEQAKGLRDQLGGVHISRIVSSPSIRCLQTVEPLAQRLGLRVERNDALAEGMGTVPIKRLIRSLADTDTVLCSHGDVIQELLEELAAKGTVKPAEAERLAKGSTWVLEEKKGTIASARYLEAP
jgi:8-oxo-dGTP diphosphatase